MSTTLDTRTTEHDVVTNDPVVEEVRLYREKIYADFEFDMDALCDELDRRLELHNAQTQHTSPVKVP